MNYRNAKFTAQPNIIDCEIEHPKFGWIPYTLDPADTDQTVNNADLMALIQGRNDVAEYVEPPVDPKALTAEARTQRNRLLSQTDYTQLADSPRDKQPWAVYRQALRDVTDQVGFPETIVWPVAPE